MSGLATGGTFNQWCASAGVRIGPIRISLEAIWNELSGAGLSASQIGRLFDDLLENMREVRV